MSDPMALKWAIVDLIKVVDAAHEGRFHGDLARIARTLGVELLNPAQEKFAEALGDQLERLDALHEAEIEKNVGIDLRRARKVAKGVN